MSNSCKTCSTKCRCQAIAGCTYLTDLSRVTRPDGSENSAAMARVTLHMDGTFSVKLNESGDDFPINACGNLTCSNGKMIGVGYDVRLTETTQVYLRLVMEICPKDLSVRFRVTLFLEEIDEDLTQPCLRDPELGPAIAFYDIYTTLKKVCNLKAITEHDLAREPIVSPP